MGQYLTLIEHMPSEHQQLATATRHYYQTWAESIGPSTADVVNKLFISAKFEALALRASSRLVMLSEKYSITHLENACQRALLHFTNPSVKVVQSILQAKSDQLKLTETYPPQQPTEEHGFVRGADYYGGKQHD